MNNLIVIFQLALLLAVLPVVVMAWRTTRRDRRRHHGLAAAGGMIGVLALVLAMMSLALALSGEEPVDRWLSFGPPLLTLALSAAVLRRSVWSRGGGRRGP